MIHRFITLCKNIWFLFQDDGRTNFRERIDKGIADYNTHTGKILELQTEVWRLGTLFSPADDDVEWAERTSQFSWDIRRQQGQLQAFPEELRALLERIRLAMIAGDMASIHAWLSGPKRPESYAQRHNNALGAIQELVDNGELSHQTGREMQRTLTEIYFGNTKGKGSPTINADAQEVREPRALLPAAKKRRKPSSKPRKTTAKGRTFVAPKEEQENG